MNNKNVIFIFILVLFLYLSIPVAQATDVNITEGERYWVGQELSYNVGENSSEAELRTDSEFKSELEIDKNGRVYIDTTGFNQDDFTVSYYNESDVEKKVNFTLQDLEFNPKFDNESLNVQIKNKIGISYQDNRNNYKINVSSPDLNDEKVASIFGKNESDIKNNNLTINSSLRSLNFSSISSGEYDFIFKPTDVNTTKREKINIIDKKKDATIKFNKTAYNYNRGSKVPIKVNFDNTSVANIVIGNETVEYVLNFTVKDTGNNGEVELIFDTFKAGKQQPNNTIYVDEDSEGAVEINNETEIDAYKIVGITYPMIGYISGEQVTYSEISLSNRTVNNVKAYSVAGNRKIDDVNDVKEISPDTNEQILMNDTLIIEADIGSIYSFFDENTNLDKDPDELNGLYLNIFSKHPNAKRYVDLKDSDIYIDSENRKFYVVKKVKENVFDKDDDYIVELGLTENSPYIEKEDYSEDENEVKTRIELKDRETSFKNTEDGEIVIIEDKVMPIKAKTNSVDGTEDKAVVKVTNSEESNEIYNYNLTAEDGKFVFFVGDELEAGDEFNVRILDETKSISGRVIENNINYESDSKDNNITNNNTTTETRYVQENQEDNSEDNSGGFISSLISLLKSLP